MKDGDERIKVLTLKHCSQLHGVSLELLSALFITLVGDIGVRETPVGPSLHYETIVRWSNMLKFDRCCNKATSLEPERSLAYMLLLFPFSQLMERSPDLRSKDNLQQIIRILNDYHEESISRELRYT